MCLIDDAPGRRLLAEASVLVTEAVEIGTPPRATARARSWAWARTHIHAFVHSERVRLFICLCSWPRGQPSELNVTAWCLLHLPNSPAVANNYKDNSDNEGALTVWLWVNNTSSLY